MRRRFVLIAAIILADALPRASALTIQLDYTYDLADDAGGGSFFADHPTAKTTLETAAADLSAEITSSLAAVSTDVFTGSSGPSSATVDWSLNLTNPVTGAPITLDTWNSTLFPANTVRIYVGMQKLSGATLGQGGPGGAGITIGGSDGGTGFSTAVHNAETASNAVMPRGTGTTNGPVMGNLSGTVGGVAYNLNYGAILGNLWFDNDTDNNGVIDSESILDAFWHFELTSPSVDGQNDFYSVALHELMHSLGFGISSGVTWASKHSGTNWLGSNADALDPNGGVNLITSDGHLREGYMSPRLSDGVMQEVVMDPSLLQGTRKTLTQMDVAILRDLNYATAPEPSTGLLLLAGALFGSATSRKRNRRPAPSGGKSCRHSSHRDTRVPARRACSS